MTHSSLPQPPNPIQQPVQPLGYGTADSQDVPWAIHFMAWGAVALASIELLESCTQLVGMSQWDMPLNARNITGFILQSVSALAAFLLLLSALGLRRLQGSCRPPAMFAAIAIVLIALGNWALIVTGLFPRGGAFQSFEQNLYGLIISTVTTLRWMVFPCIFIWYLNSRPVRAFFSVERKRD